jgi:hypothetical protein
VNRLFVEPGGFFESWISFIIFIVLLIFVGALIIKFLETKFGRPIVFGFYKIKRPLMNWYDNLHDTARNIVGWSSLTLYCLGLVVIIIWLES